MSDLYIVIGRNNPRNSPFGWVMWKRAPSPTAMALGREEAGEIRPESAGVGLTLGFADQFMSAGTLDPEIATRVVEQRHRLLAQGCGGIHTSDI